MVMRIPTGNKAPFCACPSRPVNPPPFLSERKRRLLSIRGQHGLHRGPQRACETEFVSVEVHQVEEAFSPFGVAGCSSWLVTRRECTFAKSPTT